MAQQQSLIPGLRVRSFVTLPEFTPLDQQLAGVMVQTRELRQNLRDLRDVAKYLEEIKQEMANQILGLSMSFEMVKNDMKYQYGNLQQTLKQMEDDRQLERTKHAQIIAMRDLSISQLNKKILYFQKQQQIKDKTDLLSHLRNNAEQQQSQTLNRRISELLDVIQASNKEINDLRARLRQSHEKVNYYCGHEEVMINYQDQIRALQNKIASISRELEEYRQENSQLSQEIKEVRFQKKEKANSKGRLVPRLDISLIDIEQQVKITPKPYLCKALPSKSRKLKQISLTQQSSSFNKQPVCQLFAKSCLQQQQQPRHRIQTLPLQNSNSNSSKVKIKRLIEKISTQTSQPSHLRSVCEMEDHIERQEKASITDREFVQRRKPDVVDNFLSSLRKSPAQ